MNIALILKCKSGKSDCAGPYAPDGSDVCFDCAVYHDKYQDINQCKCSECSDLLSASLKN